jgi:hypothetical protein
MLKLILLAISMLAITKCNITVISRDSSLRQTCDNAPGWKLNLCNLTCATCLSTDSTACGSCDSQYIHKSNACSLTNLFNTYLYFSFFTKTTIDSSELTSFSKGLGYVSLDTSDTVHICNSNSYSFYMLGLFSNNDAIYYKQTFT